MTQPSTVRALTEARGMALFVTTLSPTGGDDTTQAQAALAAAATAGGGIILLNRGTFLINGTLAMPSNTMLVGLGRGVTTVKLNSPTGTGYNLITNSDVSGGNVRLSVIDLTIDGNQAVAGHSAGVNQGIEWHKVSQFVIDRVEIKNCFRGGIIINGEQASTSREGAIRSVEVHDCLGGGIWVANGQRAVTWTDVTVHDCGPFDSTLFYGAVVIDASEQVVNNLVAYGNTANGGAAGIVIRNVFACQFHHLRANRNGRQGIYVVAMTDSLGSDWLAFNNSDAAADTYDDVYFDGAGAPTWGYGTTAGIVINGIRCGRLVGSGTNWKAPHNTTPQDRWGIYFEDAIGSFGGDVRLTNVHVVAGSAGTVRYPATRGNLVVLSGREGDESAPSSAHVLGSASSKGASSTFSSTGTGTVGFTSGTVCNNLRASDGTQNAYVEWDVALAAGTYTLDLFHQAGSNCGIYTVAIDGTNVGTVDGYAASTAQSRGAIAGIVIPTSGRHTIRLTMATKNGSSSSYRGQISLVTMSRTGA